MDRRTKEKEMRKVNKPVSELIIPVDDELHLQTEDGQVVVSSRYIAERFGKQHKDVLESIRNLEAQMSIAEFSALFISSTYKALNGKTNPQVLVNRDGFTLLAMGFTGKEALHWKLKYIEAFNKMEAKLRSSPPKAPSISELVQFIQLTREQMKEQGCSPKDMAKVTQEICNQYGIQLPKYFIKPEETSLKEVYDMIDYICEQPRGRGIRKPTFEDFIAHQVIVVRGLENR